MKKQLITILAIISGALCTILIHVLPTDATFYFLLFAPGFVFGLCLVIAFISLDFKAKILNHIIYLCSLGVLYIGLLWPAGSLSNVEFDVESPTFFIAGALGGLLTVYFSNLYLKIKPNILYLLSGFLCGTFAFALNLILFRIGDKLGLDFDYLLFVNIIVIWQLGIGFLINQMFTRAYKLRSTSSLTAE